VQSVPLWVRAAAGEACWGQGIRRLATVFNFSYSTWEPAMRMIKRILFSVTVVATAMVATGVSAQQGQGRGGFGGGGAVGGT